MPPSRADVQAMVHALFTVNAGLERARRRSKGASMLSVLQLLAGRDGVRPSELAEQLGVHASLVTRQVQELERAGLVQVNDNPSDARSLLIVLTRSGTAEQQRLTQIGLDRFARFVADWEPEEVRRLTDLLLKLERSKAAVAAREESTANRRARSRTRRSNPRLEPRRSSV